MNNVPDPEYTHKIRIFYALSEKGCTVALQRGVDACPRQVIELRSSDPEYLRALAITGQQVTPEHEVEEYIVQGCRLGLGRSAAIPRQTILDYTIDPLGGLRQVEGILAYDEPRTADEILATHEKLIAYRQDRCAMARGAADDRWAGVRTWIQRIGPRDRPVLIELRALYDRLQAENRVPADGSEHDNYVRACLLEPYAAARSALGDNVFEMCTPTDETHEDYRDRLLKRLTSPTGRAKLLEALGHPPVQVLDKLGELNVAKWLTGSSEATDLSEVDNEPLPPTGSKLDNTKQFAALLRHYSELVNKAAAAGVSFAPGLLGEIADVVAEVKRRDGLGGRDLGGLDKSRPVACTHCRKPADNLTTVKALWYVPGSDALGSGPVGEPGLCPTCFTAQGFPEVLSLVKHQLKLVEHPQDNSLDKDMMVLVQGPLPEEARVNIQDALAIGQHACVTVADDENLDPHVQKYQPGPRKWAHPDDVRAVKKWEEAASHVPHAARRVAGVSWARTSKPNEAPAHIVLLSEVEVSLADGAVAPGLVVSESWALPRPTDGDVVGFVAAVIRQWQMKYGNVHVFVQDHPEHVQALRAKHIDVVRTPAEVDSSLGVWLVDKRLRYGPLGSVPGGQLTAMHAALQAYDYQTWERRL